MESEGVSRRLILGLPAWLAVCLPEILAAQEHAHRAAQSVVPLGFEFLTAVQAAEVQAVAAQIIPSGDSPGAQEAGAVYFIDRALHSFERDKRKIYTQGLGKLQSEVRKRFPPATRFANLSGERQIELLRAIEKTEFFQTVRLHTIIGFLAHPQYGGNRDLAGWSWIGFEDRAAFEPPFGYYDAES